MTDNTADDGERVLEAVPELDVQLFQLQLAERAVLQQRFAARALVEQTFDLAIEEMDDGNDQEGKKREACQSK